MEAWAVVEHNAPLEKIKLPLPEPTGTQVLLEVTHCGVCHSDLHFWEGTYDLGGGNVLKIADRGIKLPRAVGHEIAGRILKAGSDAGDVTIGAPRLVYPWVGCAQCRRCKQGDDNLCAKQNSLGVLTDGGFASHVMVPHPRYLIDPGHLDLNVACTYSCSGITSFSAVSKLMPLDPEDWIVLIGAGGVGLSAIAMLRALGHKNILSTDISPGRRDAVMAAGAKAYIAGSGNDLTKDILAATDGPVLGVVDFVNNSQTSTMAYTLLSKGGKMVQVGVMGGELKLSLVGNIFKAVTIMGNNTGNLAHLHKVVELAKSGKLLPVPVQPIPWDDADKSIQRIKEGKVAGRQVLVRGMGLDPNSYRSIYINGQYCSSNSDKVLTLRNPKDNSIVADGVPIANEQDVDLAVKHAEAAFRGPWSKFTAIQRTECMQKLVALLDEQLISILTLDSLTSGNPVSLIPTREKTYIKNCILYYSGWTDKMKGDYLPADDGFVKLVRHEPIGVCAAINPFNAPIATTFLKVAPCLATGNVMIIKPSEKTPLGSLALAPLFEQAGFPPGVIQVLSGDGSTGALLAKHMKIRKISFTGSIPTGKAIQVAAAQSNLKRVTLELGGKSPAVVFDDANIDNALTWTINAILARSGQVCMSATRVYVQKSISEEFIKRYVEKMKAAAADLGDPQDMSVKLGPLVDQSQFERVKGMVEKGRTEAELVVGGVQHGDTGFYMEPTVFLNPKVDADIYQKEIFGPVAVIRTFETEEEAIDLANDTEYGLVSGLFTKDVTRAMRVSALLDAGVVGVNCVTYVNMQVPFGGRKQSGTGREMGEYALRAYTEPKTILINMNA